MVALTLSAPPVAAQSGPNDYSLRLGTFNAYIFNPLGEAPPILWYQPIIIWGEDGSPTWFHDPCPFGGYDPTPWTNYPFGHCEPAATSTHDSGDLTWAAQDLADRIITSGYDIIALQEVWWDNAEAILRTQLSGVYPYSVSSIDDDGLWEGSGLMLFSKFPFVTQGSHYYTAYDRVDYELTWNGLAHSCSESAGPSTLCGSMFSFWMFNDWTGAEALSQKGVAFVRVFNTDADRVHNIFFTHLQSGDSFDLRLSNMGQIHEFIVNGMANSIIDATKEDIFLIGDLNIDGDFSNSRNDPGPPLDLNDNLYEWSAYFKKGGSPSFGTYFQDFFAGDILHDTWQYEHPIFDTFPAGERSEFGHTADFGGPGKRLDLILSNAPSLAEPLCNQHPQRAFNLLSGTPKFPRVGANPPGGRDQLANGWSGVPASRFSSDHYGVNGHFNRLADHCSPLLPASADGLYGSLSYGANPLSPSELGETTTGANDPDATRTPVLGRLEYPASVQWHYLHPAKGGTYLIGLDELSQDLGYMVQVYRADNLSMPEKYYGETLHEVELTNAEDVASVILGHKYVFDDGPYYIKVFHPEHRHRDIPGNEDGEYTLGVNRVGCADKGADACVLLPNTHGLYEFPAQPIQSSPTVDSMYFEFAVERLMVPQVQQLQFDVFGHERDVLASALVSSGADDEILTIEGEELQDAGDVTGDVCDTPGCSIDFAASVPNPSGPSQRLVWRVSRLADEGEELEFTIAWATDLTVLFGGGFSSQMQASWLTCKERTDPSPHDEVEVSVTVDGFQMWSGAQLEVGRFREGGSLAMDPVFNQLSWPWRYKLNVGIVIVESDIGHDDTFLLNVPPRPQVYGPLSSEGVLQATYLPGDGLYTQLMLTSHGLQAFTAD